MEKKNLILISLALSVLASTGFVFADPEQAEAILELISDFTTLESAFNNHVSDSDARALLVDRLLLDMQLERLEVVGWDTRGGNDNFRTGTNQLTEEETRGGLTMNNPDIKRDERIAIYLDNTNTISDLKLTKVVFDKKVYNYVQLDELPKWNNSTFDIGNYTIIEQGILPYNKTEPFIIPEGIHTLVLDIRQELLRNDTDVKLRLQVGNEFNKIFLIDMGERIKP